MIIGLPASRIVEKRDDLTGGLIGDVQLVRAASGDRVPEAVAQLQPLPVLGVLDVARDGELLRILRDERIEVLLGDALETCAIAFPLRGCYALEQRPRDQHDPPHRRSACLIHLTDLTALRHLELLLQPLPVRVVVALEQVGFERELRRSDRKLRLEQEDQRVVEDTCGFSSASRPR